ncbi:MAG TPA: ABC transporter ATP-binding protein [Alphaproteobacteria bacterium]|nr:ABC transporter ATP-binding protein [Alphaproteobacteria bacterium]
MNGQLLGVEDLTVTFPARGGRTPVVDGISLTVAPGEVLALVGESGCGKSMTALAILRLIAKPGRIEPGSRIVFEGREVLGLKVTQMRALRGAGIAMIFQEPMASLNPVQTVGNQVIEALRLHERVGRAAARDRAAAIFERVGIPDPRGRLDAYPHQLSGGLKQRVMIAMMLVMRPRLLIADEPTTALDVTVQAQILALLRELQNELDMAVLLITHDFGVVNELADRVAVMYGGRIAEQGTRAEVLGAPRHPYTQGLLRSIPSLAHRGGDLEEIKGTVPSLGSWPAGCRFATRCPKVFEPCDGQVPQTVSLSETHHAACHDVARDQPE